MCRPAPDQTIYPFDCLLSSQSFTSEFTLEYYNHYSPHPYTLWFPPSIRINTTAGWLTEDHNPLANNHHPLESAHFRGPTSALEVHREGKAEWNKIKHWKKTIYVQTHITTRGSGQSRRRISSRKEQLGSRPENPLLEEFLRFSPITCLPRFLYSVPQYSIMFSAIVVIFWEAYRR